MGLTFDVCALEAIRATAAHWDGDDIDEYRYTKAFESGERIGRRGFLMKDPVDRQQRLADALERYESLCGNLSRATTKKVVGKSVCFRAGALLGWLREKEADSARRDR